MSEKRIKTESEFIEEFGKDWRIIVSPPWNPIGHMDYLFGRYLSEREIKYEGKRWCFGNDYFTTNQLPKDSIKLPSKMYCKEDVIKMLDHLTNNKHLITEEVINWFNKQTNS